MKRAILVEGGIANRARAMDQCLVDVLLLSGLITIRQHQSAEYFMDCCAKSHMYIRSFSYSDSSCSSHGIVKKDRVYFFPYARMVSAINKELSIEHSKVLHDVIIEDVYSDGSLIKLTESLDFIYEDR